jgi:hypothetical protein
MAVLVLFSLVATVFVVVLIGRLLLMRMFVLILARGVRVGVLVRVRVGMLVLVGVRMLVLRAAVRVLMFVLVLVIPLLAHGRPFPRLWRFKQQSEGRLRVTAP